MTIPRAVFPSCTSHGLIINIAATTPSAKAIHLRVSIFSDVKMCAITIAYRGLVQKSGAAVAALHLRTPIWKATMLIAMPTIPRSAIHAISFPFSLYPLFLHSKYAAGARISPPMRNLTAVSWNESRLTPPILRATSIVAKMVAAIIMQATTFFIS